MQSQGIGQVGSSPPPEHVMKRQDNPGKVDFLTLLAAQLRYQSPLEPMSERDMVAQLAQFSMLEELEKIRAGQEGQKGSADLLGDNLVTMSAVSLLGREITALIPSQNRQVIGKVTAARWEPAKGAEVQVKGEWIPWNALTGARLGEESEDG